MAPTLKFMVDQTHTPGLRLSPNLITLRDFSKGMRTGELAQGVCYAYWKLAGGYSWITDFKDWTNGLHPPISGKQTPDFVMLNRKLTLLSVMEAKGTSTNNHQGQMKKALQQCKAAKHKAFSRYFASVLTLDAKHAGGGEGRLHICDPENEYFLDDELAYFIFRRSYASWFDLAGDSERTSECLQPFKTLGASTAGQDTQRRVTSEGNTDSMLIKDVAISLGLNPDRIKFKIDPEFDSAIKDFNKFKKLRNRLSQLEPADETPNENNESNRITFPDGTEIIQE